MTAHPIELIAGLDDGMDLDQKDEVSRHIASCDMCRTTARTMQRVDSLIALPEPTLPLPAPTTRRQVVGVPRWASLLTIGLTFAVVIAVTVGSLRQTQVGSVDTCGLLTAAARSAGIGPASAKAAAVPGAGLPSRLAGSWTVCGYGGSLPNGALLLFRSRATTGWEVSGLLADVTSADRALNPLGQEMATKQLVYGKFSGPGGDTSTERWITEEGSQPGNGQATAVLAEPYFFVVIAPSRGAAFLLADAIVAELRQRPWPPLSEASKIDACDVIRRVAPSAGLGAQDHPLLGVWRHWAEIPSQNLVSIGMSNNVCAFRDENRGDQHLWIREEPTTLGHATVLLAVVSQSLAPSRSVDDWVHIEAGMWIAHGQWTVREYPNCIACPIDYTVIAVFDGQRFFALTQATDEAAIQTARAVLAELQRP